MSTESVSLSPQHIRAAYNPFEHGCWMDFANKVTQGYMADERDEWTPLGNHHEEWLERFDGDSNFAMLCHRDGLKTTVTLIYLAGCLEYLDGFRAYWITNTRAQAHDKAHTEFNKVIERNPWLTNLNNATVTNKERKEFPNGASLHAGWLFGGIEGGRAHVQVLDDVIKERGDGATEDVLTWIQGVTVPMVKDGGKTVVIGTRKRPDDIYQHFRDQPGYEFVEYPAILDVWDQEFREDDDWRARRPDPGLYTEFSNPFSTGDDTIRVLWPEARGPEWLSSKRDEMSAHLFWREYCMVIRGASGNLVDAADVNRLVDDGGCSIRGQTPPSTLTPGTGEATIVAHDPAQSKTGDNAAFVAFRVGRDGRRTLLDAHAEMGMAPSEIKAMLLDLDQRYDPALVVIESNGMQQYVKNDAIEFSPSLRAKTKGIPTTGKKHSWENGIPRLRHLVEEGGIQFYRGHSATEDFIQAAESLKLTDGKLEGHTPDLIAAWYMAEQGLRFLEEKGLLGVEESPGGVRSF